MYEHFDHAWPLRQAFLGNYWPKARLVNGVCALVIFLLIAATAIQW